MPFMSLAPLRIAAARYVLDALSGDDLRRVADEALTRGIYSYSLGELGTTTNPTLSVVRPLFEAALRELGVPLLAHDQALGVLLTHHFGCVLEGSPTPLLVMAGVIKDIGHVWNTDFDVWTENLTWAQRLEGFDWRYLEVEHDMDAEAANRIRAPIDRDLLHEAAMWFDKLGRERVNPSWLRWNGGTTLKIAQAIRRERRFEDLPLLADALEEAGCCDVDLLEHCREQAPHVSDCWVIHLLLADA